MVSDSKKAIVSVVKLRKIDFSEKHLAKLPSFIFDEKDFFGYEQGKSEANYVTILNVVADLSFIKSDHADNIKGKIGRDDVAELLVDCLSNPLAINKTFEIK